MPLRRTDTGNQPFGSQDMKPRDVKEKRLNIHSASSPYINCAQVIHTTIDNVNNTLDNIISMFIKSS